MGDDQTWPSCLQAQTQGVSFPDSPKILGGAFLWRGGAGGAGAVHGVNEVLGRFLEAIDYLPSWMLVDIARGFAHWPDLLALKYLFDFAAAIAGRKANIPLYWFNIFLARNWVRHTLWFVSHATCLQRKPVVYNLNVWAGCDCSD